MVFRELLITPLRYFRVLVKVLQGAGVCSDGTSIILHSSPRFCLTWTTLSSSHVTGTFGTNSMIRYCHLEQFSDSHHQLAGIVYDALELFEEFS